MSDVFLVKPNIVYKKSFENYVQSYKNTNDEYYFNKYKNALENYEEYILELNNHSIGVDLPQGKVITSTFWLIVDSEVVGVVRLRHQEVDGAGHIGYDISPDYRNRGYGSLILKLVLEEAKKIGIEEAIVTCNIINKASRKIIEKNNGKLLGTIYDEEDQEYLFKYAISLTASQFKLNIKSSKLI